MPRQLKRPSAAVDRNDNENDEDTNDSPQPPQRRKRRNQPSPSPSSASDDNNNNNNNNNNNDDDDAAAANISSPSLPPSPSNNTTQTQTQTQQHHLIHKLVRLALSTEHARLPLKRTDISQKILRDNNAHHRLFKPVFEGAQQILKHTFGMTLVELPARDKTNLRDRRAAATQQQQQQQQQQRTQKSQAKSQSQSQPRDSGGGGSSSSSTTSWILISTLPAKYKHNPTICPPSRTSLQDQESEYTALYTFIVSLIYLNNGTLSEAKLERYLKRVNADAWTPVGGNTDKLLARMARDGYLEKRKDVLGGGGGEDVTEWIVGPRGKVEVGPGAVADLVRAVYGFGSREGGGDGNGNEANGEAVGGEGGGQEEQSNRSFKIEEEELNRRLERSLGMKISTASAQIDGAGDGTNTIRARRNQPTRTNRGVSDDDDGDDDD